MDQEDEIKQSLETLCTMIQAVYLPLVDVKQDTKINMEKFVKQVKISMMQAYGNITINVPVLPEDVDNETLCKDKALMQELQNTVDEWTHTIKETIERENGRSKESKTATGETEYWRARSATFNTMFQQLSMPQVKRILDVMQTSQQMNDDFNIENFQQKFTEFQKLYAQAKDFVKFLQTLDRQFKNLRGDLQTIEETLPSLLTGLKLIWTISRHISQKEQYMEDILESISNEICDKVKSQIDIHRIFKMKPEIAIPLIEKGKVVLEKWQKEFQSTRRDIEAEQTVKRWDFGSAKEIFSIPKYMITVLDNLKQTCVIISEFIAILGPDLMAVTGSVDQIDDKLEKVTQERRKLEDFPRDIFQPNNAEQWDATFKNFLNQIQTIDTQVVSLIDNTFSEKLNSSEGAFDLLAKFQNVKTRDAIKSLLTKKYEAVLKTYQKELNQMEELFKYGKAAPPIPKNMPPRAGEIAWARSIMGRIKAPIKKFKTKADQLTSKTFKEVALNYVRLAKELDENYEKKIFEKWEHENTMLALNLLGKNILKKDKQGVYKVQFDPQLKVIIREAMFLDRIGKKIPQTITNIALQDKDYARYVDKLNQLLRTYNSALGGLKEVEKKLLEKQINKLNKWMDKGVNNHNWFSLSITEYIRECSQAIETFNEIKTRVIQKAQNIEEKVLNIENAEIVKQIDMHRKTAMDITEFSDFFENHRVKVLQQLVVDYQNIGDLYLKHIQESTVKTSSKNAHEPIKEMEKYYEYWERRIFNAITKMIVRALAANKTIFTRKSKPHLITMTSSYNHPKITFHPTEEELRTQLEKISRNILESTKSFGRWWRGFCTIFQEKTYEEQAEKYIPFTFFDDVMQNKMISQLHFEIVQYRTQIFDRFEMLNTTWIKRGKFKDMFDKNKLSSITKQLEKMQSTQEIENIIGLFKQTKQNFIAGSNEQSNIIVTIDTSEVKQASIDMVDKWLEAFGEILKKMANTELRDIIRDTQDYEKALKGEMGDIEQLKALLNVISEIKNKSMDMEFRIIEVQEQFRVLRMHDFEIEEETQKDVDELMTKWEDLLEFADRQDYGVNDFKKNFAEVTKQEVESFKTKIIAEHEKYTTHGPGTIAVGLEEGSQLLAASKDQIKRFNKEREEKVLAEKLFNLPISKFPELVAMEELNKKYDQIYNIYKDYQQQMQDYSTQTWTKLDAAQLKTTADQFERSVKKLANKLPGAESMSPYIKLRETVTGFKNSLPLIEMLKHPAILERHWKRILEETGKGGGEINPKSLTLSKVFELELQNHEDKVTEICVEAKEEAKNEENMQKIENDWKATSFDIVPYTKKKESGDDNKQYVMKSVEDIRLLLEDSILILQTLGASKFVRAIRDRVSRWERDLNTISDTIDTWMITQKKWMYLESIFGNDDIKQQLPEEAKKFGKTDLNFNKIMQSTYAHPIVHHACVKADGGSRFDDLKNISAELDKCTKSLTNYLETKQMAFPRFYFISNDDLLQILGSSDPKAIQTYLLSLFDNCKRLVFGKGDKQILGMYSDEGEHYDFETPVKPEGNIEDWMNKIDDEMKDSLHTITKRAVYNYAKEERLEWIEKQIGMVAVVGTQIWWTFAIEDVFQRVQKGDKHAMKKELAKETQDLNDLVSLVRTQISQELRQSVNTLIILDVHARDVVDRFVRDSILTAKAFDWESQLRFYWDQKKNDIDINQCTGSFDYCYEYQGLNGRLVITPLTDRCVMTLTTALTFKLGGSPMGPAGTGKTETVKDLAKSLAIRCVVTNCGENMDYIACFIIFSGLAQTGFWGCFDEFNRINVEVLSVVSAQIKTIQNGLIQHKKKIELLSTDMRLIPSVGIFITMNPGYAGRSELPDNLKALFRPITMVVPNLLMICENSLMSEGFTSAKLLAKKMTVLYKLSKEQLSKAYHYDFGLRALKSVLVMAGQLKRQYADLPEDKVLMRALRDMNMPKFVFEDVPLFAGLIGDLFPGVTADRVGYETLNGHICDYLEKCNNRFHDDELFYRQVDKVVQLYETMQTRHTTMVVGPSGGGKSVIIDTLGKSLKEETGGPTFIYTINPKMITLNELYGVLDPESRDWTDGLLSKTFKEINVDLLPGKTERRWILFDGDVDAVWVENMNSVMDDNKILTLSNGDRIRLLKHCAMLFEVYDLQYASPATISRCGMVYIDDKNLGYEPFYERWLKIKSKEYGETIGENFKDLYQKYVYQCVERIFEGNTGEELVEPLKLITPRTPLNCIKQLCDLIDSMFPKPDQNPNDQFDKMDKFFIFCIMWSLGSCLVDEDREKFNQFVVGLAQQVLPQSSLYDNYFDIKKMAFQKWDELVSTYVPPPSKKFGAILVPTVDTVKFAWLLNQMLGIKKPTMFCGESGTAKTVTVQSAFQGLEIDKYTILGMNFSSRTSSMDFQSILEENLDKKTFKNYGPKANGKKMIVFIDDMNMPRIDTYGTQQPLALAHFLIGKNQLYQRGGDLELREIIDTQYVGCISPVASGGNRVDPRVITLFSCFNVTAPSKESTLKIYDSILDRHCEEFSDEVKQIIPKITMATYTLYENIKEKMPRTPVKFHYIFNLRDFSKVYEGLLQMTIDKFNDKAKVIRLWRNEVTRVFGDRLISIDDKNQIEKIEIPAIIKDMFKDVQEAALADPLLYGDFSMASPTDDEVEDPRLYEDLNSFVYLKEKLDKMLEDYGFDHKPMSLVLFNDALEHVTRIHRIIRFQKGCGLLVGFGGSGKQSLTRLATFTACYDVFTINLVRNYKENDFKLDLQTLYKTVVTKPQTFLFTDSHVAEEGFLELINNILTIGIVPGLFPEEEKDGLAGQLEDEMRKQKLPETKEARWQYFVNKCRENLHIILAMSPAGDTLRIRCRNFPGLISNTNIDWFFPWPRDALTAVAENFMGAVQLEGDQREKVIDHIVMVHLSVQDFSTEFKAVYKRDNFSTPKNYLDFIKNYMDFLSKKRKQMENNVQRLQGGLATLAKAQDDTEALSIVLEKQNIEIQAKSKNVNELIIQIEQKTLIASKEQASAAEKKIKLDEDGIIIEKEENEAAIALQEAIPALEAAKQALENVKKKDLDEVKALANPSSTIVDVCTVCYLLSYKFSGQPDWSGIKTTLLSDTKLIEFLKTYDVEKTKAADAIAAKKKMQKIIKENKEIPLEELAKFIFEKKNQATGGLFAWCEATIKCYDINKDVEPKKLKAREMKRKKEIGEKELADTIANLDAINKMLGELNAEKSKQQAELDELTHISNEMTRKLKAASQLITGLGSEQIRWSADMEQFEIDKIKLVGDCLTASAFLSYCGPFNSVLRQKMIFETWKQDLITKELPNKDTFRLDQFLTNDVEVAQWSAQGLPSDSLSVQNGILTTYASRWPLCIDPQMQAVTWIKAKEKDNKFTPLSFSQADFMKQLEVAIPFGKSVLFEGIGEEMDPMIDPILEKNIVKEAGVDMITIGENKYEYDHDFKMFLTTKIGNPNYTPEIFGKTMIINFSVTMIGLRDQLLNDIVQFEKPEDEEIRKALIVETSTNKATLQGLEDTLLSELSKETDIPLVDNVPLIDTLNDAKTKSNQIGEALQRAEITSKNIEENRQLYKDVAWRGSILFFSIQGLNQISKMYEYSLSSYMSVFMNALNTSKKDNILNNRLRNIKEKLTQLVYDFTCMGIFESHKLMYSFQMVTMIMDGNNELNKTELDFFLKGNTSLDIVETKKPYKWLTDNGWKDIQKLVTLGKVWEDFIENLMARGSAWKDFFDHEAPETLQVLPCGYEKLSKFQQLLLMRVIRPDRCINSIKNFIIDLMNGDYYVKSPPINFMKIYEGSSCKTPIVFILSPGADPFSDVQQLVETVGLGLNKFKFLALGQGMGEQAKQYIENGSNKGQWVMLQNCHLLTSWLKTLEIIFENITRPDPAFRLWLTTTPTEKFPLGILQKSLKIVTEPPDGLGQNIKQNYSKLSDEILNDCPKQEFKQMLYVLSFFHAVIQERKKFGKIGWNVLYDFNESDYRISYQLINMYLTKTHELEEEELPWDTLRYLIGEAMYGGRVTDDYDRRIVDCYLREYMGDFIFDTNQKFIFAKVGDFEYSIPKEETLEENIEFIDKIPLFTPPSVFGLHSNAEIQFYNNSIKGLWGDILSMQTSAGGSSGGINREEIILEVASGIEEKTLPEVFDEYNIRKSFDVPSPTQIVLLQELERYNKLIKRMSSTIKDLKRALNGEIGMSVDLDILGSCFFNGLMPPSWSKLAPSTEKNLVGWIAHFERRFRQYKEWIDVEEPKVIWLSGLHIPESYTTALVQTSCRTKGWALDKSTMYTNVTKITNPKDITKRLEHGTYIQGLYLEGARWNMDQDCLDYQKPKELFTEMPLVQIIPVEANKLKLRGTIKTPVYVTQARKNAMGVGLVIEADIKSTRHESHWILQGVALVLNTD